MQVKTARDVGALIRDRRANLALSQSELAARVGVGRVWIVQLEKGKPTAQLGLVLRTLKELGIMLDAATGQSAAPDLSMVAGADVVNLDQIIQAAGRAKR